MKVLVLGGAGAMAEIIERDLLDSGVDEIIIAGLNQQRLDARKKFLKAKNIRTEILNAADPKLHEKIRKLKPDALINATWYEFNVPVMSAAIKAGVHYLDLGGLYWKTKEQRGLHDKAKKAGVVCVLGMGSTPGIMNVLAEHGAQKFDRIKKIELRCADALLKEPEQEDEELFVPPYSIKTVIDEVLMKPPVLRKGKIKYAKPLGEKISMEFPKPIGKVTGYYTIHSELATIPETYKDKGLQELDFAYAYDPELIQIITALKKIGMTKKEKIRVNDCEISPYDFLAEVDKRIPRPKVDEPDVEMLRADLWGTYKGKKLFVRVQSIAHYHKKWKKSAGSVETGVPASITAQWIAQGKIKTAGVWAPEEIIEPIPFFKELKKRNIDVVEQTNKGPRKKLN